MKEKLPLWSIICCLVSLNFCADLQAQGCLLVKDSIIAGSRATRHTEYIYDSSNKLVRINYTDSALTSVSSYDTIFYNGSGQLDKMDYYTKDSTGWSYQRTFAFIYTSGKLTRLNATGVKSGVNWAMAHDITYSGNDIQSIVLDNASLMGNPDGFRGSFKNMVWQNGNVQSLRLVVLTDSAELSITYDSKVNVLPTGIIAEGAPDIFLTRTTNNMLLATITSLSGSTLAGQPAAVGDTILGRSYTYNSSDLVETSIMLPSVFDSKTSTSLHFYDCPSGIGFNNPKEIVVYPNPANDIITIGNVLITDTKVSVRILDYAGKEIARQDISKNAPSIGIGKLKSGVYFVEIITNDQIYRGKFIKQ